MSRTSFHIPCRFWYLVHHSHQRQQEWLLPSLENFLDPPSSRAHSSWKLIPSSLVSHRRSQPASSFSKEESFFFSFRGNEKALLALTLKFLETNFTNSRLAFLQIKREPSSFGHLAKGHLCHLRLFRDVLFFLPLLPSFFIRDFLLLCRTIKTREITTNSSSHIIQFQQLNKKAFLGNVSLDFFLVTADFQEDKLLRKLWCQQLFRFSRETLYITFCKKKSILEELRLEMRKRLLYCSSSRRPILLS